MGLSSLLMGCALCCLKTLPLPPSFAALYPFSGEAFFLIPVWGGCTILTEGTGHPVVMVHGNPSLVFPLPRSRFCDCVGRHRCIVPGP